MDDSSSFPESVELGCMAPCIGVSNIETSVAFYASMLGMRKTFENGNPVGFVIMKKDRAELHLSLCRVMKPQIHNVAHLTVSDANALFEHLSKSRVRIIKGLRDQQYGLRDFVISDPDGNRIDIGQPL
ncbi:MAG: VOC family protein [Gemmatimonadota bacterium]|nr:VOC family protein [Gemmatimonadota bacterium]